MEVLQDAGVDAAVFGSVIHATVPSADREVPRLRTLLNGRGIHCDSLERIPPSLEDVFVTMIERS